jgi:ABC-2 type transport system permease protein
MSGLVKYVAHVRLSWSRARQARAETWGRVMFFVVILAVFSSLWRAVNESGAAVGLSPGRLVWYLAMTEWIVLSAPLVHYELQDVIRRGDVVCHLVRPSSWVVTVVCDALGQLASRVVTLFATACICAAVFTGTVPHGRVLLAVFLTGLVGSMLIAGFHIAIGIAAFWVGDVVPLSWVWQKLLFLLGGLLMPIGLYPEIVGRIAAVSPFPVILSRPASLLWQADGDALVRLVRDQAMWCGVVAVVLAVMSRRAVAQLTVDGG